MILQQAAGAGLGHCSTAACVWLGNYGGYRSKRSQFDNITNYKTAVLGSDWRDQACTVQNMVSAPLMMLLKLFASHFALEQCLGAQVPNFYLPIILFIA